MLRASITKKEKEEKKNLSRKEYLREQLINKKKVLREDWEKINQRKRKKQSL